MMKAGMQGRGGSGPARARWSRRRLLKAGAGAGGLVFCYLVGGRWQRLTPRAARAAGAALRVLTPAQARTLEAAGDALVPGAGDGGLVHFLDAQLAQSPAASLLILRYLDVPPPYADFYRAAAAGLDLLSDNKAGFAALPPRAREKLIGAVLAGKPTAWPENAPPAALALFVLRADAIDVTYGTPEGFARLGIDYMPHIAPARPW